MIIVHLVSLNTQQVNSFDSPSWKKMLHCQQPKQRKKSILNSNHFPTIFTSTKRTNTDTSSCRTRLIRTADEELWGGESCIESNRVVLRLKNRGRSGGSAKNSSNARDEGHWICSTLALRGIGWDPQNPSKPLRCFLWRQVAKRQKLPVTKDMVDARLRRTICNRVS